METHTTGTILALSIDRAYSALSCTFPEAIKTVHCEDE